MYVFFLLISVLLIFEMLYRYSVIDFYKSELQGLNTAEVLEQNKEKTLLVFGDSFTADKNTYLKKIADSLPNYNIINSAIPGTSVFHTKTFFKRRINQFKPDHILIQIYVGNDLIDYSHPVNWSTLSFIRNLYWSVSDKLIGLQYINLRMGQFKESSISHDPKTNDSFNVNTYNHREKLYYKGDSKCLYNTITCKENQEITLNMLINDLKEMLSDIDIKTTILIIPHGAQVSQKYQNNMKKIGAVFENNNYNFSFYEKIKIQFPEGKNNTKIITPLSYFKSSKKENLYYLNDPHLSKIGQDELSKFILQEVDFNKD
jgi:hypothetical protein